MVIGTAIIFVLGVGYLATLMGFQEAVAGGFLPFIWGSIFKIGLGAAVMPFAWRLVDDRRA
jgi:biotin transport system substrate-specific component